MRRIRFKDAQGGWIEGWFHQWSQEYEEFEAGPGMYTVAVVEDLSGLIHLPYAKSVRFVFAPDEV